MKSQRIRLYFTLGGGWQLQVCFPLHTWKNITGCGKNKKKKTTIKQNWKRNTSSRNRKNDRVILKKKPKQSQ